MTELPGSVVDPDDVPTADFSVGLRAALQVVKDECRRLRVPIRVVARPEIFTHGELERRLRVQLGTITQHLCISDGTTIKLIEGCDTHVLFYSLTKIYNYKALQSLSKRAPELVAGVRSQINTSLSLGTGPGRFIPEPIFLRQVSDVPRPSARLMPFFFNQYSAEDTANRIEQRGEVRVSVVPEVSEIIYVPLTETSLSDRGFAYAIGSLLLQAFFRPDMLLLLRLPDVSFSPRPLQAQVQAIMPGLLSTGLVFPLSCPPNVLFATTDLSEDSPILADRCWSLIIHDSFDFWRHPPAFYEAAERISVMATPYESMAGSFMPLLVAPLLGPKASRAWLRVPD